MAPQLSKKPPSRQAERPDIPQDSSLPALDRPDFLWKVIQRYDVYINGSNAKAAILITFNTFVLGTIVIKSSEILGVYASSRSVTSIVAFLLIATSIAATVSMWFGLNAIAPIFTSSKEPTKYHSLIFFDHVSEFNNPDAYRDAVNAVTPEALTDDLAKQAHALAGIAKTKFRRLMWSVRCIVFAELPGIILMIIVAGVFAFLSNQAGGQP